METPVFVAREPEMARLTGFLQRALAGQGLVCFVSGEAGSGKTALVTEFARRAQQQHADLVVAVGQSDAHTGAGDAYLPFREVLALLTGDVDAKLAQGTITQENAGRLRKLLGLTGQALVEVGPDLIGVFVPGVGLATQLAAFVAGKAGWFDRLEQLTQRPRQEQLPSGEGIDQGNIFEQYINVLKMLAQRRPLLLLLDDLQWADAGSIGLLFRLGRRIEGSRILLVGTYRPDELALGRDGARHPLVKVLTEFKRYQGDIWVELDEASEAERQRFVEAFLETESNRLDHEFRQALYHHTDGHPLFTVELLRNMQERGDLVRDEAGRWIPGPLLDWGTLPPRVEGVIEERIGRLEEELREMLSVASVEGEEFTAEVVARIQAVAARELVRRLGSELDKQHRLVSAQGVRRLAAQRLSLYRFQHNLVQTFLYNDLDEAERAYLHEDVGSALEELYGDQADEIAVQLARHFVEAEINHKARTYSRRAGEQAAARFANDEAVSHFSRALDLIPEDDTAEQVAERCDLLLARARVYGLQGVRTAQATDLADLAALATSLGPDHQAEVALVQSGYAEQTGDYPAAIEAAQQAIAWAQATGNQLHEAAGHRLLGVALWRQGNYEEARTQYEQALAQAQAAGADEVVLDSLRGLGLVTSNQGDYGGALVRFGQALDIAQQIGDRQREGQLLNNMGVEARRQGDHTEARRYYEQALAIFHEIGERKGESACLNNLGLVAHDEGDYARAAVCFHKSLGIAREIGDRQGESQCLNNLARVAQIQGDFAGARIYYDQALGIAREIGDRWGEGIRLLNLGWLFSQQGDYQTGQEYSQQALNVAQELGSQYLAGYAWAALGHAQVGLGRLVEASHAYQQAFDLWQGGGQQGKAMQALAGLAGVSHLQGELSQALAQVEKILGYLETNTLDDPDELFQVYLTCYRVLRATEDPRAREVLAEAHRQLQELADRIPDADIRRSFLENVPDNREIVGLWRSQQGKD